MTGPTARALALILVAAGGAGASMVTMMEEGKLNFCGKQACFAPNVCLPFLGVNVCVRTDSPKCSAIKCPDKHECALLQDVCDTLPCHPKAYCVKHNPCGICLSPDHFCELLPTPVCRHVVEPTCLNKKCGFGEMCKREPLECAYPPCRVKFSCVPAWPYHYEEALDIEAKKSAGGAKSRGAVSTLGGVFNSFNGFNPDVEKAFIAGRLSGVTVAGDGSYVVSVGDSGGDASGATDNTSGAGGAGGYGADPGDTSASGGLGGYGGTGGTGGYGADVGTPGGAGGSGDYGGTGGTGGYGADVGTPGGSGGYGGAGGAGSYGVPTDTYGAGGYWPPSGGMGGRAGGPEVTDPYGGFGGGNGLEDFGGLSSYVSTEAPASIAPVSSYVATEAPAVTTSAVSNWDVFNGFDYRSFFGDAFNDVAGTSGATGYDNSGANAVGSGAGASDASGSNTGGTSTSGSGAGGYGSGGSWAGESTTSGYGSSGSTTSGHGSSGSESNTYKSNESGTGGYGSSGSGTSGGHSSSGSSGSQQQQQQQQHQQHYSSNRFGYSRPVSHAAGVVSTLPSVGGAGSYGGKTELANKKEEEQVEEPVEEEEEEDEEEEEEAPSESDTDEEEEEEPDQAL